MFTAGHFDAKYEPSDTRGGGSDATRFAAVMLAMGFCYQACLMLSSLLL